VSNKVPSGGSLLIYVMWCSIEMRMRAHIYA